MLWETIKSSRGGNSDRLKLNLREGNTHTNYHVFNDIVVPICEFMLDQGISNLVGGHSEKGIAMKDRTKDIFERCRYIYAPPKSESSLSSCFIQNFVLVLRSFVLITLAAALSLVLKLDLHVDDTDDLFWKFGLMTLAVLLLVDMFSVLAYTWRMPRFLLASYILEPVSVIILISLGCWSLSQRDQSVLANKVAGISYLALAAFYLLLHGTLHR